MAWRTGWYEDFPCAPSPIEKLNFPQSVEQGSMPRAGNVPVLFFGLVDRQTPTHAVLEVGCTLQISERSLGSS